MNHKTIRTSAVILAAVLALSLLLTACTGNSGNNLSGSESPATGSPSEQPSNEPSEEPSTVGLETVPSEQPSDETPLPDTLQTTEDGMVSIAGTRYYGGRCSYIMPEGWACRGTKRMDDANASNDSQQLPFPVAEPISTFYQTAWMDTPAYDTLKDGEGVPTLSKWQMEIIEYDGRIADFDTFTAEEWYINRSIFQTDSFFNLSLPDVKAERTTVDENPAVRVTWQTEATRAWMEFWAIDTQAGLIKISLYNGEVAYDEDVNRAWVEDFMSAFEIDR